MQRAAATRRRLLFCQNVGWQLPPLPPYIKVPNSNVQRGYSNFTNTSPGTIYGILPPRTSRTHMSARNIYMNFEAHNNIYVTLILGRNRAISCNFWNIWQSCFWGRWLMRMNDVDLFWKYYTQSIIPKVKYSIMHLYRYFTKSIQLKFPD